MELPSIGKHCSDSTCSQLDFLPFSCQYCKQIFCQDHWRLEGHVCPKRDEATQQDQRVPICPLCSKPVPVKKGEDPNLRMEQHISAGCPEPATTTSKPIYTNSCNFKACKNRSAIPIVCQKCRLNYCLKHRLEGDHACASLQPTPPTNNNAKNKKGNSGNNSSGTNGANGRNGNANASANTTGHHWSLKNANAARNARAAAAAQQRANASSSSSAGKKDKDKCVVS